ncbi:MAG: hypothetical protein HZY76_00465 [Anaerolineae bacterium]|nr:MAG: hypothetical protein HZY76_00465 [Anaerolineae bacterium]
MRGEHRLAYERFSHAVQQLEAAGWLGEGIRGRPWTLRIEVRRGGGLRLRRGDRADGEHRGQAGLPRLRPPSPPQPACGAGPR